MRNKFLQSCQIVSCFFCLFSCSNHLSRDSAKEAIIKSEDLPKHIFYEFDRTYLKGVTTEGNGATSYLGKYFKDVENMITFFQNKGLVAINEQTQSDTSTVFLLGTTIRTYVWENIELTDLGKKYFEHSTKEGYKVRIWDIDFGQIDGIKDINDDKNAEVTYTVKKINITPFGKFFVDDPTNANLVALFSKYDDGWKINPGKELTNNMPYNLEIQKQDNSPVMDPFADIIGEWSYDIKDSFDYPELIQDLNRSHALFKRSGINIYKIVIKNRGNSAELGMHDWEEFINNKSIFIGYLFLENGKLKPPRSELIFKNKAQFIYNNRLFNRIE